VSTVDRQTDPLAAEDVAAAVIPTRNIVAGRIDADAMKVVRRLRRFGHSAYLVGGCVRDLMLRRRPKDFDVATSARPNEIRKLFRNCRLIGRRFRLAHIIFRDKVIETATFRAAVDNHGDDLLIRSDNVFGSEQQDAYRRDFTINGLFYDPVERHIIDYVGGMEDLARRILRFIGEPEVRVQEDPVRILRAIRFAARLGFSIEPATYRAMQRYRQDVSRCAPPRLLEEVIRMLRSGAAQQCFQLMWECGVLPVLLPEVARFLARSPERGEEREPGAGLFAYLRALDAGERELLSNPVLLAAVLLHPVADIMEHGCRPYGLSGRESAPGEIARLLLRGIIQRLSLPRWQAERIQQVIATQFRLRKLRPGMRAPRVLLRRNYFPEALDLFSCGVRATSHGRRLLRQLQRATRQKPPAPAAVPEPGPTSTGAKTRRRRRRPRRRPGKQAGG